MDHYITVNDDCFEWNANRFESGYGRMKISGKTYRAHRVIYECAHGPIPEDMVVMHTCDNRACVRLDHLRLGTHLDNMADMVAKSRQSHNETRVYTEGEKHHNAKLTNEQVEEVRERFEAGGTSQSRLAEEYGVSQALISKIVRGLHR